MRQTLQDIAAYKPGKRPAAGQVATRLASNETPFAPLPSVVRAIAEASGDVHRYPDPAATALTDALADFYAVTPEQVSLGCGSVALVEQLLNATVDAGDEVVYGWRSFEAYPVLTRLAAGVGVPVPLRQGHLDLDAMRDAITPRTRLVLLCTPNNPTGPALARTDVVRFLQEVPEDVLVVCDEAYYEFVTDPAAVDGVPLLPDHPNLAVTRTFSKAYGLAGLRVGYCLASPTITAAVRKVTLPFSVNSVAQAAAIASLAARSELAERVATVVAERATVREALLRMGFVIPETQGNFVWLELGESTVEVAEAFEADNVLVRAFAGEGIRVTVTEPGETARLLESAQRVARLLPA